MASHFVADLTAAWQVNLHLDLFGSVENLLDRDYALWAGYPERGRRVRVGAEYRF
jgi:outer membrane receptor protein involved in Fe transport